jgi:hypothetical protein
MQKIMSVTMMMVMEKNLFQKSLILEHGMNWTIKEEIS